MNSLGLAEIADRIHLEPGSWSIVVAEEHRRDATAEELREELSFMLEEEGVGSAHLLSEVPSGPMLIDQLARMKPEDVALLPLPEDRIDVAIQPLEYERTRLLGGPSGVILTSEAGLQMLAAAAPNFWSWIGPRVWELEPRAGRLDPAARLASLREGTGLSDVDVIARAEAGTLALDPVFSEWLVLLGRGDLLGP